MRIVSLDLENIRSYQRATISFSEGITLLSGDIGAGKSTLLIATEFALFGLSRGELSGAGLLRHGEQKGACTIEFTVQGTTYRVHRTLKRAAQGIVQDTGWIEQDGRRETLTPTELKARVFEILGYSLQFLGKKNALFRFTLYTPQEAMKHILLQPPSERLEAVRRVFGVDIYKRIRDGEQLLSRAMKAETAGRTDLIARMQEELATTEEKLATRTEKEEQYRALQQERTSHEKRVAEKETRVASLDAARAKQEREQQLYAMQQRNKMELEQDLARLRAQRDQKLRMQHDGDSLQQPKESPHGSAEENEKEIASLQESIGKVRGILEDRGALRVRPGALCPTCQQRVSEEHVHAVANAMAAKSAAAQKKLDRLQEQLLAAQNQLQQRRRYEEQLRVWKEQKSRQQDLRADIVEIEKLISEKQQRINALPEKEPSTLPDIRDEHEAEARELSILREQRIAIEKRTAVLAKELEMFDSLEERKRELSKELEKEQKAHEHAMQTVSWLRERFTPVMDVVEQRVLRAIHGTFHAAVRKWFTQLVEDDTLMVTIGSGFTPLIQQNGYEVEIADLSGGEKTALALAYRLGLVHTIHALVPGLGTAGLLILDEPTDGFSSEQLARVREVLGELEMEQVVIVSHEPQLEGFVDQIIRVEKHSDGSIAKAL